MKRLSRQDIERAYQEPKGRARKKEKQVRKADASLQKVADSESWSSTGLPQVRETEGGVPVRIWTQELEASAWRQLSSLASLPFMHPRGIAVMPDVHLGSGACVGSVLPLRKAMVPAAVGLDIGCGMVAVKLDLRANQLPDNLRPLRLAIEEMVPLGSGGSHQEIRSPEAWLGLEGRYLEITEKHRRTFKKSAGLQLGTLGAGNHFIEVCLDESSGVWVMIHSGSRGVGALIGQCFIEKAHRRTLELEGRGLGWLPEGDPLFEDYRNAVLWAQDYAKENRAAMLRATLEAMRRCLGKPIRVLGEAINCHHNYVAREHHFGEDLWVTRKGAIRAGVGEWGIIPGSMGAESFIVQGKGNPDSYCSCSHGAGRLMSRTLARERFTTVDLRKQTSNVECRKDRAIVDEIPMSYKPIRKVMKEQEDLVDVVHTLKQVICIKGS